MTYLDVGEVSLVRKLNTLGIDMFLYSAIVARSRRAFNIVDSSLDRHPNKTSGLYQLAPSLL